MTTSPHTYGTETLGELSARYDREAIQTNGEGNLSVSEKPLAVGDRIRYFDIANQNSDTELVTSIDWTTDRPTVTLRNERDDSVRTEQFFSRGYGYVLGGTE